MRGARFHVIHMVTGAVIAVLLGIHMVVLHLDDIIGIGEQTSWQAMIARSSQGIWAALYIAMLAFVLYHALYGLRGILLEVTTSPRSGRILTWVFIIIGIVIFSWGAYVPIALLS